LEDAYALRSPEDSRQLYARWAATYESGFVRDNLYVIPDRVAEVFAEVADPHGVALDVGCGTGLAAQALVGDGRDWIIDGVDISPQMLAVAARKRRPDGSATYRRLFEADLTAPVTEGAGEFAGVFSSGTFTHGHLGPREMHALLRFGRPGCTFAIGINAEHFETHAFAAQIEADLEARTIVDYTPRTVDMYLPGSPHFGETAVVAVFTLAST